MQFLQMWILPSKLGLEPDVEQRQYTLEDRRNRLLRIIKPEGTDGEGISVAQDASMFVSHLEDGVTVEHAIGAGHGGYFYLIQGRADVNDEHFSSGDSAYILDRGLLRVRATTPCELLLVDTTLDPSALGR
jgi:redox-sensitive bicupin YhaK (pirin superfamily)